jgi:D-alanyl-D-alanine carboxypeptidase/D-alanyl-D-alanine-endopeptidase (penicillin-binding protein 4)
MFLSTLLLSQENDILEMKQWEEDSLLRSGIFSHCVIDVESGKILSSYNRNKFLIPASCLKVVTCYSALRLLGSSFTFTTRIGTDGNYSPDSTELNGNIILESNGDPTLQSRFFYTDDSLLVDKWVQMIKKNRLKKIKGKIVFNLGMFPPTIPENWIWGDVSNAYGAAIFPINYRDNTIRYIFKTGAAGTKSELITTEPSFLFKTMKIKNYVISKGNEDEAFVTGCPFSYEKRILGSLPVSKNEFKLKGSCPEPWRWLFYDLLQSLKKEGITLTDTIPYVQPFDEPKTYSVSTILYTHHSPKLEKIVKIALTHSHNLYTEALLIAALGNGNGFQGIVRIMKFLESRNIPVQEISMQDGSGLSRNNLVTTHFFSQLLFSIAQDKKYFTYLYNSLPVSGKSGTLLHIGNLTPLANNLTAKTGFVNKVRSFAGYMKTKSGKMVCFSLIVNNYNGSYSYVQNKMTDFMLSIYEKM